MTTDLPCSENWRFDNLCPNRIEALENAGSPSDLINALSDRLSRAIDEEGVRWGCEHARDDRGGHRIVIQIPVGSTIFDWFFNARTGYRAHFRASTSVGLEFNRKMINSIRQTFANSRLEVAHGRELKGCFEDIGPVDIQKSFVIKSLLPDWSKIWLCTKLMQPNGEIESLPLGLTRSRIYIACNTYWAALDRDDDSAWLDCKGAFLGEAGPHSGDKLPEQRAQELHESGGT